MKCAVYLFGFIVCMIVGHTGLASDVDTSIFEAAALILACMAIAESTAFDHEGKSIRDVIKERDSVVSKLRESHRCFSAIRCFYGYPA